MLASSSFVMNLGRTPVGLIRPKFMDQLEAAGLYLSPSMFGINRDTKKR